MVVQKHRNTFATDTITMAKTKKTTPKKKVYSDPLEVKSFKCETKYYTKARIKAIKQGASLSEVIRNFVMEYASK